jgi:large subunit ribosomal protein L25
MNPIAAALRGARGAMGETEKRREEERRAVAENALSADVREAAGKGVARKLRAAGRIPAVVYGGGLENVGLSLDPVSLDRLLHASGSGMNTLIDLRYGGTTVQVLLKDLQRDPVRGGYLHADFYRVNLTETVEVSVPIHLVGEAAGVRLQGGILDHSLRELLIECLPTQIPNSIDVDVQELAVGQVIHVRDLPLPEGVEALLDPDQTVASVVLPAAEEAAAAAEVEAEVAAEGAPAEGAAKPPESGS